MNVAKAQSQIRQTLPQRIEQGFCWMNINMSARETAIRKHVFKIDHNHKTQGSKPKKNFNY